jgi:putative MATE family efflux protein
MANFLALAFIQGLSVGVQAMAARRKGEGNTGEQAVPLNGGLVLAVALAIPITVAVIFLAPVFFPALANHSDSVVEIGIPYLQIRFLAIAGVGCNFAFRGYWNGVSMSRMYMKTLVFMHVSNVVLNWVFIFGNLGAPELGATGAGLASAISVYLGTGYYFVLGLRHARGNGFLRGLPEGKTLRTMLRLALPSAVQQFMFAGSIVALFAIIARVGTAETAAANVLVNLMLVAILPGIGLGISSASLVGQALGRGDPADAARWGWDVVRVGAATLAAIGLPMILIPDLLLSVFIHTEATIDLARPSLMVIGASICLDGVGLVLMQSLLGAGAARTVMLTSVSLQWLVMLPATWYVGVHLGYGLLGIWVVQGAHRALQASIYSELWRRGAWKTIEV